MKQIVSQLIDDFQERELPDLMPRDIPLFEINGKASVIIGMRRSGKTWFLFQKIKSLLDQGVSKKRLLYLNFEDDRLLDFHVSQFQDILDVYFAKYPTNKNRCCFFFFDEIQRIIHLESFIRRLIDTENILIFISGSSSKLLSSEIATCLRGRSLPIVMYPFSFSEFLRYHDYFSEIPNSFGSKNAAIFRNAIAHYFRVGGFPEIQFLEKNLQTEILQGYLDSVLLKDIIERHQVSNIIVLKYLLRRIIHSCSEKFSVNKFYHTMKSMSVKCSKDNLYTYMEYLTDAFVCYKIPIHTFSEKARTVNPVKIYVVDNGLVNAMTFRHSVNNGALLENLVFLHLRRNGYEIAYINTQSNYETDFLANHPVTGDTQLIQVCWDMSNEKTFNREVRGLISAKQELSLDNGLIITWDTEQLLEQNIMVLPIWKWLLSGDNTD
jgi:hypothetical protein